jgi:hypothetical protein
MRLRNRPERERERDCALIFQGYSSAAVAGEVVGLQEMREENAELKRLDDDFLQVSNETQAELNSLTKPN